MSRLERVLLVLAVLPFGVGFLVGAQAAEPDDGDVLFAFTDERIVESSGLVARDGLVETVNDSGNSNQVFTVDPASGDTVGVTTWPGEAEDVEAIAPAGRGEVWVGDIGDNGGARDDVALTRVPVGRGDREVDGATYRLSYPDGPHDAETLLVHPLTGRVYVVAKEFIGRLYAAPSHLEEGATNRLELVDEVLGIATDGAFFPDGGHLVIRNYRQAAFYTWPGLERVGLVDLPPQPQGEGIAVTEDGQVLVSSEGTRSEVLRVRLPAALREQLAGPAVDGPQTGTPSATPLPDADRAYAAPAQEEERRSWWPWALGGVAGTVILAALLRSLRPR